MIEIYSATIDNDIIIIDGAIDGEPAQARGWLSAMSNFYPDDSRDNNGHRTTKASSREMTDAEKLEYLKGCIAATVPASPTKRELVLAGFVAKPEAVIAGDKLPT